jgi:DNA polymerase-3 subunit delta'
MARSSAKPARASETQATVSAAAPLVSLDDLLGQPDAVKRLRRALQADRLHHAFIFHGPSGVGKFTAAHAFARALLDPGDGSPPSVQARAGTHTDLHVIRKELAAIARDDDTRRRKQTNIPVEVLREFLLEPVGLAATVRSGSPAAKVFIIDEADLVDPTGQNTLLKTLEEPPPDTVIILVTAAPDRLLPTVKSRCQPVGFAALDAAAMADWLSRSADLPKAQRDWVLWFAEGSPGLADLAIRRNLFAWHEALGSMLNQAASGYQPGLGLAMAKLVDEQAAQAVKENPDSSKEAANRFWARRMLAYLARHFRDAMREQHGEPLALRGLELLQEAERAVLANVRGADVMENFSVQLGAGAPAITR